MFYQTLDIVAKSSCYRSRMKNFISLSDKSKKVKKLVSVFPCEC